MALTDLLHDVDNPTIPLSDQLLRASSLMKSMSEAGELDTLDVDAKVELTGVILFLRGASDRARELETEAALDHLAQGTFLSHAPSNMGGTAMGVYRVTIPVVGCARLDVKADTKDSAIHAGVVNVKAKDVIWEPVYNVEFGPYPQVAEAQLIDDEESKQ